MIDVVKLSVHKNNKRQKERKQLRSSAKSRLKDALNMPELEGYFLNTWDAEGNIYACFGSVPSVKMKEKDVISEINKAKYELLGRE